MEQDIDRLVYDLKRGPKAQIAAAIELGKIGDSRAVETLIALIRGDNYDIKGIKTTASKALEEIGVNNYRKDQILYA